MYRVNPSLGVELAEVYIYIYIYIYIHTYIYFRLTHLATSSPRPGSNLKGLVVLGATRCV